MKGQVKRLIGRRGRWRGRGLYPPPLRARGEPRIPGSPVFAPSRPMSTDPQPPANYEAALADLDQLGQVIESGQLPLEQLLSGYKRGAELLAFCRGKLDAVEHQIKLLDEGTLKPWTPQ